MLYQHTLLLTTVNAAKVTLIDFNWIYFKFVSLLNTYAMSILWRSTNIYDKLKINN